MIRYAPARHYLSFGTIAFGLALFSGWLGTRWIPAFIPCALFLLSSLLLVALANRPQIELHPHHLSVGRRILHWMDIRRVDSTRWMSPLVVRITLFDDSRVVLIYPGDLDSCQNLLRQIRRASRDALIDGVPFRQYWGEMLAAPANAPSGAAARYRMLRPEDEAEVERLYQRLKTVGHLDPKPTSEEK